MENPRDHGETGGLTIRAGGLGSGAATMANVASSRERRIVVAVDESEESLSALRWCLRNLVRPAPGDGSGAKDTFVLLYARPSPPVYSAVNGTENGREHHVFGTQEDFVPDLQVRETGRSFSEDVTTAVDMYGRDLADSVTEKARNICKDYGNVKVDVKISVGDAREVICQMVDKLGADLLVMGSHGYGFIKRALLGSVSDHCARNAKCPVLIVKHREA
ncbi:Universal stress protein [Musa troglodytarum]|uniref:Universal stress protein n=1 Tax=Musa troglodytarum TaxID=320322 RepID=A0A9E7EGI1_9LILI|nr:Universal stress protein [Musa troglodytarum]